uniref:Uncharacterized protein n=1 Tax=Anguilla anguilla TaxID=7936 RepID=A0A0E9TS46_ANGAN
MRQERESRTLVKQLSVPATSPKTGAGHQAICPTLI